MPEIRIPTVYIDSPKDVPVLTVENRSKWYVLSVLYPSSSLAPISFEALEEVSEAGESAYVDHVPNPDVVERYAEHMGWYMCPQSLEMIRGRWYYEVESA